MNYPAAMANAILFTLVLLFRTTLDWQAQIPYAFLLNCLQASFALGAVFSLAALTYAHRRGLSKNGFLLANLAGLAVAAITFLLLYFFGGYIPDREFSESVKVLTTLASARVFVAGLLSLLAFLLLAGEKEDHLDFSGAVFMTLKAFFLALIYGLVIMGGVSGVFGAVQALIYSDLDSRVFGYIASISGFIAFSIFVGYFPDFRKGVVDEHREVAESQPRFITVLLEFILVPIMLALTVVLLLWAVQTIMGGMNTRFINLYSIATAFAIGGLLLHILITKNESEIAKFYKKVFPFAALIILLFEAWALIIQLNKFGLKTTEYLFIVIWIIAFASAILLILRQAKAHRWIVYVTSMLAVVSVLPLAGFTDLPFITQINRLESILTRENMIRDGQIVPAQTPPARETREVITETVDYLVFAEGATYPDWLDPDQLDHDSFQATLGFDRLYPGQDPDIKDQDRTTSLMMMPKIIDVSEYQWGVTSIFFQKENFDALTFTGEAGDYEILWKQNMGGDTPAVTVKLNGETVLEGDLKPFIDATLAKYPLGTFQELPADSTDLTYKMESDQVMVTLMFERIEINSSPDNEFTNYLSLNALFLNEK